MKKILMITVFTVTTLSLTACGKGSATARLRFQEQAQTSAAKLNSAQVDSGYPASTFKMKLIAAYLSESVDPVTQNNTGNTQMIWMNPECNNDIMHCNISSGTAEDGLPWFNRVTSFFNFSNTILANASLNEQNKKIDEGQYRYVRLEFCKTNPDGVNNVQWASEEVGITEPQSFRIDQCGVNSTVFNPPLEVKEDATVTISLKYSLSNLVKQLNYKSPSCVNGYCFELPQFSPTATVE